MRTIRTLKRIAQSRRGNVSLIFALASPLVIGSAALGVETSYWYYKQHQLQAAADNAAYAAGLELQQGSSSTVINAAALNVATKNSYTTSGGTITVTTPPTSGPYAGNANAVTVALTEQSQRFFTQLFSTAPVVINANATSVYAASSNACVLALDPVASAAAYFGGNTNVSLSGCVVMSNSSAANAIDIWGSPVLTADCIIAHGNYALHGTLDDTVCPAPIVNATPAKDPYANIPQPTASGCATASGTSLSPGTYCGGLTLHNNMTLSPGVYVINGGTLKINANANISGTGVTIYLTGGATLSMNGNAQVNLSAPTSGTYAGILMMSDKNDVGLTQTINGNSSSTMTGALYFPSQAASYIGNFSGQGGCTYLVADTVSWSGNTHINENCTSYGMSPIPVNYTVKLVG